MPDPEQRVAGDERWTRVDGVGPDQRPGQRPGTAAFLFTYGGSRLLQRLCRCGYRCGEAAGRTAYGGVSVHSGADLSQGRRAGAEAEQSAVVPQSEVGDCGGAARGGDSTT